MRRSLNSFLDAVLCPHSVFSWDSEKSPMPAASPSPKITKGDVFKSDSAADLGRDAATVFESRNIRHTTCSELAEP